MPLLGTDPESYISEYTLVHEDQTSRFDERLCVFCTEESVRYSFEEADRIRARLRELEARKKAARQVVSPRFISPPPRYI